MSTFTAILGGLLEERLKKFMHFIMYGERRDREETTTAHNDTIWCGASKTTSTFGTCETPPPEDFDLELDCFTKLNTPNLKDVCKDYPDSPYFDSPLDLIAKPGRAKVTYRGESEFVHRTSQTGQYGCAQWLQQFLSKTGSRIEGTKNLNVNLAIYAGEPPSVGISDCYVSVANSIAVEMGTINSVLESMVEIATTTKVVANHIAALVPKRNRILERLFGKASVHPLDYYFMYAPTSKMVLDIIEMQTKWNVFTGTEQWIKTNAFTSQVLVRPVNIYIPLGSDTIPPTSSYLIGTGSIETESLFRLTGKVKFAYPGLGENPELDNFLLRNQINLLEVWRAIPNSWFLDSFLNFSNYLQAFRVGGVGVRAHPGRISGIILNEVRFKSGKLINVNGIVSGYDESSISSNGIKDVIITRAVEQDASTDDFLGNIIIYQGHCLFPGWMELYLKGLTKTPRVGAGLGGVKFDG